MITNDFSVNQAITFFVYSIRFFISVTVFVISYCSYSYR